MSYVIKVHPETPLLLYFQGYILAKDLAQGSILMGANFKPNIVIDMDTKQMPLYEITYGDKNSQIIVSSDYKFLLYNEFTESVLNTSVSEYLMKTSQWKSKHKMILSTVEYPEKPVANDPFIVGSVLAGGMPHHINIKNSDEIKYIMDHKYIPDCYIYNSRENRKKLLDGFIESSTYTKIPPVASIAHSRTKSLPTVGLDMPVSLDTILGEQLKFIATSIGHVATYTQGHLIIGKDFSHGKPQGLRNTSSAESGIYGTVLFTVKPYMNPHIKGPCCCISLYEDSNIITYNTLVI
jgi:hypothetical protein